MASAVPVDAPARPSHKDGRGGGRSRRCVPVLFPPADELDSIPPGVSDEFAGPDAIYRFASVNH